MNSSEWSSFEDQDAYKIRGTRKVSHAVIRLRMRLAKPSYVWAAQSGKTEAIVKVANHARGFRVKVLMEYVGRTDPGRDPSEQIELEDQNGLIHKGPEAINEIYQEWSESFERAKPGTRRPPRHGTHLIFSAKTEKTAQNMRKILHAAKETAREHFEKKGFDYVIGLHQDADFPHVHFVVRNKNREPEGRKFKLDPADLFVIRENFAKKLTDMKLEHVATLRRDRPSELDRLRKQIATGIEQIERQERQFQRAMARKAPNKNALLYYQDLSRNIVKLRQKVKDETRKGSKERLEMLASIRRLERSLVKKDRDINKELEVTIRSFTGIGKAAFAFRYELNRLNGGDLPLEHNRLSAGQLEGKKRFYGRELDRLKREVKQTRGAVDAEPLFSGEEKKAALDALHLHEKAMKGRKIEYILDKIVEKIGKEVCAYENGRKEGINPDTGEQARSAVERLNTRRALDKFEVILGKRILAAKRTVEHSAAMPEYKKERILDLEKLARNFERNRSRQRSR